MTAKPDQPEKRDQAMSRLLVEALQRATLAGAADRAACPDAELIAAYADQGLADDEREHLEGHFAACGHCQKALAVFAAGGEVAISEPQSAGFVEAVEAPAPATPRPAVRPSPSPQRWFWWLAPAFGAAAAAMLYMAMRPASPIGTPPVQTAADYSQQAEQKSDSLSARANAPSSPAETPPAAVLDRLARRADGNLAASAEPAARARELEARDEVVAMAAPPLAETAPAAPAARSAIAAAAAPPLVGGIAQGAPAAAQSAPVAAANDARNEAAQGPVLPAAAMRGTTLGGTLAQEPPGELPLGGRDFVQLNLYSFSSPDGGALWRLGAGGSIARSTDRGQSWQQLTSGVTSDLVSGSAASRDVAWIVGRAGVILRTTDGVRWQPVVAPAGFAGDWAAVVARNALSASVVAADRRRFSTEDAGRTWTQQQ